MKPSFHLSALSNADRIAHMATLLALANDYNEVAPFHAGLPSGQIMALANDSQFEGANLNEPLTQFVAGLRDQQDLAAQLEGIAPSVPVSGRRFSYMQFNEAQQFADFATGDKDAKARGGEFGEVKFTGTEETGRLYMRGLQVLVDVTEGGNSDAIIQRYASFLSSILLRAEIIRAVAALDAAATDGGTKTWSSGTSATPDTHIASSLVTSGDARGIDANRVIMGKGEWLLRFGACQRNQAIGASALLSPEQVASILGLDKLQLVQARKGTTSGTKTKIVSGKFYSYYANPLAVAEDPSNIKRFNMGGGLSVITEQVPSRTSTRIVVFHESNTIVTNTVGIVGTTVN